MKKRPNRSPRYGAMSDSTCKENSVSANSSPAKNAPKAIESPACLGKSMTDKYLKNIQGGKDEVTHIPEL